VLKLNDLVNFDLNGLISNLFVQLMLSTIFTSQSGARQPAVNGTIVLMLNNALPNRASAISAVAALQNLSNVDVIAIGMTSNVLRADMSLLVSDNSDIISSVSYQYLSTKVQSLSTTLCSGIGLGM